MNLNPVSFGKKYIRQANAVNNSNGSLQKLDFVEYEKNGKDLFRLMQTKNLWKNTYKEDNSYIEYIASDFFEAVRNNSNPGDIKVYALEDDHGEIQAVCELMTIFDAFGNKEKNTNDYVTLIKYISTNPKSMYGKKSREYSKLGISLFKETLKQAKKEDTKGIILFDSSGGFWDKIPNMETNYTGVTKINFMPHKKFNSTIKRINAII